MINRVFKQVTCPPINFIYPKDKETYLSKTCYRCGKGNYYFESRDNNKLVSSIVHLKQGQQNLWTRARLYDLHTLSLVTNFN